MRWVGVLVCVWLLAGGCIVDGSLGQPVGEDESSGASSGVEEGGTTGDPLHPECEAQSQDDACTACAKENCCQELHECELFGEPCPCVFGCLVEGHSQVACEELCGGHDAGQAVHYAECIEVQCADVCIPP